jgi:hypothetical protein
MPQLFPISFARPKETGERKGRHEHQPQRFNTFRYPLWQFSSLRFALFVDEPPTGEKELVFDEL